MNCIVPKISEDTGKGRGTGRWQKLTLEKVYCQFTMDFYNDKVVVKKFEKIQYLQLCAVRSADSDN